MIIGNVRVLFTKASKQGYAKETTDFGYFNDYEKAIDFVKNHARKKHYHIKKGWGWSGGTDELWVIEECKVFDARRSENSCKQVGWYSILYLDDWRLDFERAF